MEIMFGAKRFNRISVAFPVERNSGIDRGDLANLTAFVAVEDLRGAVSRLSAMPSAPLDAAAGGVTRGALAAPYDA
jgi:hypothetical protein